MHKKRNLEHQLYKQQKLTNNNMNLKTTVLALCLSVGILASAQPVTSQQVGFEELKFQIPVGEVWNGSNGNTQYVFERDGSKILSMTIGWDTAWGGYWSNLWAFSRQYYNFEEPSNFTKQLLAAKPGGGAEDGGQVYAIGAQNTYLLNKRNTEQGISGFYVSNTTFAFNSMRLGDNIGKKFQAADKDSFVLIVRAYQNQTLRQEKRVYMADFRATNADKHFILDSWQYVAMDYPDSDSIHFELQSSDVGSFGINTPTYFALDAIDFVFGARNNNVSTTVLNAYPNPCTNRLYLANSANIRSAEICDYRGRTSLTISDIGEYINVRDLTPGLYYLRAQDESGHTQYTSFVKNEE